MGFEIPSGFYGLICNRTSGGFKGILPVGHVVDAGYTGEVILILYNTNPSEPITIEANEGIAQLVVIARWSGEAILAYPSNDLLRPSGKCRKRCVLPGPAPLPMTTFRACHPGTRNAAALRWPPPPKVLATSLTSGRLSSERSDQVRDPWASTTTAANGASG